MIGPSNPGITWKIASLMLSGCSSNVTKTSDGPGESRSDNFVALMYWRLGSETRQARRNVSTRPAREREQGEGKPGNETGKHTRKEKMWLRTKQPALILFHRSVEAFADKLRQL